MMKDRYPDEVSAKVRQIVALEPIPDDELWLQRNGIFSENPQLVEWPRVINTEIERGRKCGADTAGD